MHTTHTHTHTSANMCTYTRTQTRAVTRQKKNYNKIKVCFTCVLCCDGLCVYSVQLLCVCVYSVSSSPKTREPSPVIGQRGISPTTPSSGQMQLSDQSPHPLRKGLNDQMHSANTNTTNNTQNSPKLFIYLNNHAFCFTVYLISNENLQIQKRKHHF